MAVFDASSTTTREADFESFADGTAPAVGGSPNSGLVVTQGRVTATRSTGAGFLFFVSPDVGASVPSRTLVANGQEEFDLTFAGPAPTAIGFDYLTNTRGPITIDVFDTSDSLLDTLSIGAGPPLNGFFGILSDDPIGRLHWTATEGNIEDTGIDNIRLGQVPEPGSLAIVLGLGAFLSRRRR